MLIALANYCFKISQGRQMLRLFVCLFSCLFVCFVLSYHIRIETMIELQRSFKKLKLQLYNYCMIRILVDIYMTQPVYKNRCAITHMSDDTMSRELWLSVCKRQLSEID